MNKRLLAIIGIVVVVVGAGLLIMMHMSKTPAKTVADSSGVPAVNNAVLKTKSSSSLGQYLTDPSGKALYTYGSDTSGMSNCSGTCLATWPPYVDSGSTTGLPTGVGTITRTDNGKIQFTYNDLPLYYFIGDALGHVTGNGVGGFHLAKPVASPVSQASTPTPKPAQAAYAPAATPAPAQAAAATPMAQSSTPASTPAPTATPASSGPAW
jgi:predicted lipoprotein with Yx(FWY)xxD motif